MMDDDSPNVRPTRRRPGFIRRLVGSAARAPVEAIPWGPIREQSRLIGTLARAIRQGPSPGRPLYQTEHGEIDLTATAFSLGMPDYRLAAVIAARRRQTARVSYGALALGAVFVVLLVYRWARPGPGTGLFGLVQFVPFAAVFLIVALRNAHDNWQLRHARVGSVAEFFAASDIWPKP